MEFCHIRGCIHTCVVESYTTVSRLHFYTTINTPGPNIVCKDQLNRARVSVFSGSMSAISISQRKCKRLSNMDHVLGSLAVGIKKGTFTVFVPVLHPPPPPPPPHTHTHTHTHTKEILIFPVYLLSLLPSQSNIPSFVPSNGCPF